MKTINIPIEVVLRALEAMYFTFSPSLEEVDDIMKLEPWIFDLVKSYNELIYLLPEEICYEHKLTFIK